MPGHKLPARKTLADDIAATATRFNIVRTTREVANKEVASNGKAAPGIVASGLHTPERASRQAP
jgi:hypothetical protein